MGPAGRGTGHRRDIWAAVNSQLLIPVPGPGVVGWLKSGEEITPSNFEDNRAFIQLLHETVKNNLDKDPELQHMAALQVRFVLSVMVDPVKFAIKPMFSNRRAAGCMYRTTEIQHTLIGKLVTLFSTLYRPCALRYSSHLRCRIPETEDIVGSVMITDGKLVPSSYEPMPVHRLVTMNGLFKLSKPLHNALVTAVADLK